MKLDFNPVHSAIGGMVWPGLPAGAGATLLAMLHQLDQSQWWTAAELEQHQFLQLENSLRHAYGNVPFHRERLAAAGYRPDQGMTLERLRALPVMTRRDVQEQGDVLRSTSVPEAHGRVTTGVTSGSTGMAIHYDGTEMTQFLWRVFTVRDHVWRQRDPSGKLAAIRPRLEDTDQPGWGPATELAFATGHCFMYSIRHDLDDQLDWLARHEPTYLVTMSDNLHWLARRSLERGIRLPGMREARSYGSVLREGTRDLVRKAWGVPVTDIYSAEEVGYIALQCSDHEHYHAQSENLIVEILDAAGNACSPGEIGRVVITTLHNFAMPLIRYEIGDYAEAGAPCPCGRGLPVIARIMGRSRNIMTLPDGRQRWPSFVSERWSHLAPVRQLQLVQKSPSRMELRVVPERALTDAEVGNLIAAFQGSLGYPFEMELRQVAEIPRSASYKFEDFVSEIV
jgi:phenylacetate-CoA ligase